MLPASSSAASGGISPFAGFDMARLLARRAAERPDHPLLVWVPEAGPQRNWTYAAFAHDVARLAGGLAARGVKPGDRVLVHLENCPETLIVRFACAWLGAVCVVTNPMAAGPELAGLAETAAPRAAITQPRLAGLVASHVPDLDWIAVTATDAGQEPALADRPQAAILFETLYGEPLPARAPDPHLPALILFTTGTTARAKAVLWTHENLLWGACIGAQQQGFRDSDVTLLFLPLFHVVGFSWTFLPALWRGGTVVLQPRYSASRFWPLATAQRATVAAHVPFTIGALKAQDMPARHDFRMWITNRQMPDEQARYGVENVSSAWGMTEMVAQPVIGNADCGVLGPDAIGRASPAYALRIVDGQGGDVAPGEAGELLVGGVRGRSIFSEYFGDSAATEAAFDERGYFRTGDRVSRDADGAITFVDRIKDVIKVGGEGVAAGEIEAVVAAVPGVREVAVVAGPDPLRGEVPVAFVVRADGADDLEQAIETACRQSLARFKVPQRIVFVAALPKVGFGKIAKAALREMAKQPEPAA